ncbi:MAG: 50S ribosomal protein L30 [Candidatus Latescibacterota bacterium]|nr:MAG: 50S ribosomal protein L30 [Candidatus Latescibacterota bacterium]
MGGFLEVRLVRSVIGASERQKRTVRALGLRKIGQKVVHKDLPQIRGMVRKVSHLVEVREVEE